VPNLGQMGRNPLVLLCGRDRKSMGRRLGNLGRRETVFPVAAATASPAAIVINQVQQMMNTERVLEVVAVERIFLVVEAKPEEGLKPLDIGVNPARVRSPCNTLEDQEATVLLDQPFGPGLPNGQECSQYVPTIGLGRQPEVCDGHDIVHMQAAQQFALRISPLTMRHNVLSSFSGWWLKMTKPLPAGRCLGLYGLAFLQRALEFVRGYMHRHARCRSPTPIWLEQSLEEFPKYSLMGLLPCMANATSRCNLTSHSGGFHDCLWTKVVQRRHSRNLGVRSTIE